MTRPMTPPVPNLPLLRKVLSHIDEHPDEWDQRTWGVQTEASSCGTAYCVAGHALNMTGHALTFRADEDVCGVSNLLVDGLYDEDHVQDMARKELGLTAREAHLLFLGRNSRADIQSVAAQIAYRAGEVL